MRKYSLEYASPTNPGWSRQLRGGRFAYFRNNGRRLTQGAEISRIDRLAIPPAWTDVWICPSARGHIQATGRDARGRLQYRYHSDWRAARDATKYDRMVEFGRALPAIRRQVARDARRPPLSREAVLATVVRLLEATLIRVGNAEYARTNGSYGLTTLRNRHVEVRAGEVRFHFRGKSGQHHDIAVRDRALARRLRRLHDLPGQELFQYVDAEGGIHRVTSEDVNDYLHSVAGAQFSAKDFRTWAGTLAAAEALGRLPAKNGRLTKRQVNTAIESVAAQLGNTPAICRKCYIHPAILESFGPGGSPLVVAADPRRPESGRARGLRPPEKRLLAFLRAHRRAHRAPTLLSVLPK
jgi:DNA topoisomerase-1